MQLYAARSRASWGIGDLGDLRRLARWSRSQGAGVGLLNPLHAVTPGVAQEPSPYYPSSRCFRNPIYLRIEEVPGVDGVADELAAQARALNEDRLIDRDAVWRLKQEALERAWERFRDRGGDAAFEWVGLDGDEPPDEVVVRTHELLAQAPSRLLNATLDDALAVPERPNWSLALPVPLEDIEVNERVAAIGRALCRTRQPMKGDGRLGQLAG